MAHRRLQYGYVFLRQTAGRKSKLTNQRRKINLFLYNSGWSRDMISSTNATPHVYSTLKVNNQNHVRQYIK
jgi:hypothetical protein